MITGVTADVTSTLSGALTVTLEDDNATGVSTTVSSTNANNGGVINTGTFDTNDTVVLAGDDIITVNVSASTNVTTGDEGAKFVVASGQTATINAAASDDGETLTLSGAGSAVITNLLADVDAQAMDGTLVVTTQDGTQSSGTQTIAIATSKTDTTVNASDADDVVNINATALADNDDLTITGASTVNVTNLVANIAASALTGDLHATIKAGGAVTSIVSGSGDDTVTGSSSADILTLTSVETVESNGGDDVIGMTDGLLSYADLGAGNDRITLGAATTATILGDIGTDTVIGSAQADVLRLTSIESLDAGDGDDVITITDTLLAIGNLGKGDDTLTFEDGSALTSTVVVNGGANTANGQDVVNVNVDTDLNFSLGSVFTGIEKLNLVDDVEQDGLDATLTLNANFDNGGAIIFDASTFDAGEVFTFNADAYVVSGTGTSADAISVIGGAGDDVIITAAQDAARGWMTVDLSSGGVDTVTIANDTQNGSKTVASFASVATFTANFVAVTGADTLGATIQGFTAGNGGDRLHIEYGSNLTSVTYASGETYNETITPVTNGYNPATGSSGQIEKGVVLTTTNLGGVSSGDVIEISSANYQLGGLGDWDITSVAGRLANQGNGNGLVGLQDGYYTVAIYSDDSNVADAFLFNIRVDGGDGLDFSWGANTGGDFDMIEYVGVIQDIGADTLQAVNFI